MKGILNIVGTVLALHVAVLSFVFGPRQMDYVLTAYFSAVFVWGTAFWFGRPGRALTLIGATMVLVVIQQAAYRTMASEGCGFWWPLIQFCAIHFMLVRAAKPILDLNRVFFSSGPRVNTPV